MAGGQPPTPAGVRGAGVVQVALVLLITGILTLVALRLFEHSPMPMAGPTSSHPAGAVLDRVEFRVEGMSSAVAGAQVEEALRRVPGVASVAVDSSRGRVQVTFDPHQTSLDQLLDAVEGAGFRARR